MKTQVEGGRPQAKERGLGKQSWRILILDFQPLCCSYFSVTKLCLTLCDPMDSSRIVKPPLSFTISQSLLKFMSTEVVLLSKHLMLCLPLLLPSIFPSIRVFSLKKKIIFSLYNIVLVLPYIDMNPPWVYMCSPSWTPSHLPPHPIPLGHPSAPAPSTLYHALNLDWWFVSHVIIYTFQCHSPKSSCPRPLPQSPNDCSIHLCLFSCLTYRVIVTMFLNSIYMH